MSNDLPAWVDDPDAATPPLDEYLAVNDAEQGNVFWMLDCGHHENLLAEAVAQRDEARAEVEVLRGALRLAGADYIKLEDELRAVTSLTERRCEECGADITDYATGLTLCAICDEDVDDK